MKRNTMIAAFILMAFGAAAQTEPQTAPVKDTVPVQVATDSVPKVENPTVADSLSAAIKADPAVAAAVAQPATTAATTNVVITPIKSPEEAKADYDAKVAAAASRVTYSSGLEPTWSPLEKGTIVVFDGQAYVTANNKAKPVMADMTLSDGSIVSSNGTILKANGKKIKLKNGQEFKYGQAPAKAKS